jgi:hypothetical protein
MTTIITIMTMVMTITGMTTIITTAKCRQSMT